MSKRNRRFCGLVAGLCGAVLAIPGNAQIALPEAVETAPLARDAFSTGVLDRASGALAPTLWDGADPQVIDYLLTLAPTRPSTPSVGEAMRRMLLSPGSAPQGAPPSLGGKKLLALARAGFFEEARTVASLSNAGRGDPWTGQALAVADLLEGNTQAACRRGANLASGRDAPFWVKLRVFCYAEAGEQDAADLTLNILREQGLLSEADIAFLTAVAIGAASKAPLAPETPLQFAVARSLGLPIAPGLIVNAYGGVLAAIARDETFDVATRIAAAERAVAMGVAGPEILSGLFESVAFDLPELANAATAARQRPGDPLTDALLYQSVQEMSAPEFIRDKAQRIATALGVADAFHRAYALSVLYADDIKALEGVLVAPQEAQRFAAARMAAGDAVGAAQWLRAMVGEGASVAALPEPLALAFIDQVNLLALLDPQTAAQVARAAGVSLLQGPPLAAGGAEDRSADRDAVSTARILEAAFDAAIDGKAGQAGLAALAASNITAGGEVEAVIVNRSLDVAGLGVLSRRHDFERAWAASFAASMPAPPVERGFGPRLKPRSAE